MAQIQDEIPMPKNENPKVYWRSHVCQPGAKRESKAGAVRYVLMQPALDSRYAVGTCPNCKKQIVAEY